MKISLARALKYKNRVTEKMRKVEADVQANNSVLSEGEPEIDVKEAMEKRAFLEEHLVLLKRAIDKANEPVKQHIYRMQEIKARISFLSGISTQNGPSLTANRWGMDEAVVHEYKATLRKNEIDQMIVAAEAEIDAMQEELDRHNNTTAIDIELVNFAE